MTVLLWFLLAQVGGLKLEAFWPQTAVGWLTFVVVIGGVITAIGGWSKHLNAINGLGGRVTEVERQQQAAKGREEERDKAWAKMVQAQADLQRQIGEAKNAAEACETNSEEYFIQIGSGIKELTAKVEEADRNTHGRLTAIETELRIRNQASPLYVDKK